MGDFDKNKTYTYTINTAKINPSVLYVNLNIPEPIEVTIDRKLTTMQEYKEAKEVLKKFTLNGKN